MKNNPKKEYIVIEKRYYIDERNGEYIYDQELMQEEFDCLTGKLNTGNDCGNNCDHGLVELESKKETKSYSIDVNFTELDLYELNEGKEFNWTFDTNEDENIFIDIRSFKAEDHEEDDEEVE
jgi:hypothetical protein